MPPFRRAPVVTDGSLAAHVLLVDFDAEPRALRNIEEAVLEGEAAARQQVVAEIARGVNNVRKVVRVFENISEQELASYNTRQQPAPVVQDPAAK